MSHGGNVEIERKFKVEGRPWEGVSAASEMWQGYLARNERVVVRVRVTDRRAWLTIKSRGTGIRRSEYEYEVPLETGREMLELCEGAIVHKTRHVIEHRGSRYEVDVFHGENEGLVVAELELEAEDQPFARPAWLGEEVSHDPRYLNVNLAHAPYRSWTSDD